jgi:hypothetical protein
MARNDSWSFDRDIVLRERRDAFCVNAVMSMQLASACRGDDKPPTWETVMRLLLVPTAAVVFGMVILALSAKAAPPWNYRHYAPGGYHTYPYWQGEPTDRLPIWRHGYYQGNDPDNFIRLQLMRDPPIPMP